MDEILSAWIGLAADLEVLVLALDGGYDGVIHALGEYADSAIQSLVPAYATAVQVCATVSQSSGGKIDCTGERIKLRDNALSALVEACGLKPVINATLKAYRQIPKELRDVAVKGAAVAGAAVDAFTDPSFETFKGLALSYVEAVKAYFGQFLSLAVLGKVVVTKIATWVAKFTSSAAGAILDLLKDAGHLLADGYTGIAKGLGDVIAAVVPDGIHDSDDVADAFVDIVTFDWF